MKYDLDHSTAYFQQIFSEVSNNDMTGGVEALESLSTYLNINILLIYIKTQLSIQLIL